VDKFISRQTLFFFRILILPDPTRGSTPPVDISDTIGDRLVKLLDILLIHVQLELSSTQNAPALTVVGRATGNLYLLLCYRCEKSTFDVSYICSSIQLRFSIMFLVQFVVECNENKSVPD